MDAMFRHKMGWRHGVGEDVRQGHIEFVVEAVWTSNPQPQGNGPQPQAAGGSATARSPKTYRQTDNWTCKGDWVVANQQAWETTVGCEQLDIATDGFVQLAEIVGLTSRPEHEVGKAFRIQYGDSCSQETKNAQWEALAAALCRRESRNFFYLGHGDSTGIGATPNSPRFISASQIESMLHTKPAGHTDRHGFRFVFLYSCSSANGKLPESFGVIPKENVDPMYYYNAALTPSAFVGQNWNTTISFLERAVLTDHVKFLQNFQTEWTVGGHGVKQALENAIDHYSYSAIVGGPRLPIVFGNWDLTFLGYNKM
jgi:hypothetical protein